MTQTTPDDELRAVLRPSVPVEPTVLAALAAESALVRETTPAGTSGDPDEQLRAWSRLLAETAPTATIGELPPAEQSELRMAIVQLVYSLARDPMPAGLPTLLIATSGEDDTFDLAEWEQLPDLVTAITQHWLRAGVLTEIDPKDRSIDREAVNDLLDGLGDFIADEDDPAAEVLNPMVEKVQASPLVRLTALGDFGLRELLIADGWEVPLVGSYRDVPAEDLLDRLEIHLPDDALIEAGIWLAARGDEWASALRDVADPARTDDPDRGPVRRAVLGLVLRSAGPRVAPVLDDLATDPWLSAICAGVRAGLDLGSDLSLNDDLWLTVDGLSSVLAGDEEEQTDAVEDSDILDLLTEPGAVYAAAQLSHPRARPVLQMIAEVCGDRQLTARLRRALAAGGGRPAARPKSQAKPKNQARPKAKGPRKR